MTNEYHIKNENSELYLPKVEFWILDDLGLNLRQVMLYKIKIKINDVDCNLWLYFYDENTVTIQQIFSYNKRVKSINYSNKERMRLDFKPIHINREKMDKINRTLSKYY